MEQNRSAGRTASSRTVEKRAESLSAPRYMAHGNDGRAIGAALTRQALATRRATDQVVWSSSPYILRVRHIYTGEEEREAGREAGKEETKRHANPTARKHNALSTSNYSIYDGKITKVVIFRSFAFLVTWCDVVLWMSTDVYMFPMCRHKRSRLTAHVKALQYLMVNYSRPAGAVAHIFTSIPFFRLYRQLANYDRKWRLCSPALRIRR
jgi:hypothetical protein